jgi:3-oxoacyl-[acyl-carrier-protein] synthase II
MTKRRVVVTGIGCLTPLGSSKDKFWNALLDGKSGAQTIDFLDTEKLPVKFSASVKDYDPEKYFDRKDLKKWIYLCSMVWQLALMLLKIQNYWNLK